MKHRKPVQVIAVTGGKGGVGKTNVSVNLSIALARRGNRVALFDADLGLAKVDVMLGLSPARNLEDVLRGECALEEAMVCGPENVQIFPAASGTRHMVNLGVAEHNGLVHAFSALDDDFDYLIVDTAAGLADGVVTFVRAAQEVLVVVCDEPTSITDAYGLIKLLNRDHGLSRFRVLANMVKSPQEADQVFRKINQVTDRFLDVALQPAGMIPSDECVRKAVKRQRAVMDLYPGSPAGRAFDQLAGRVETWPPPRMVTGHAQFFVERIVAHAAAV